MPTPQEVEQAREWMETQRNTGIFSSQHEDVYDLLAAYHAHASAEERRRRQAGKTHWPGCWKDHLDCAVEKIETAEAEAEKYRRLVDKLWLVVADDDPETSNATRVALAKQYAEQLRSALDALKEEK